RREPALPRRALPRPQERAPQPPEAGHGHGRPLGTPQQHRQDVLGRDEAAPGDRPGLLHSPRVLFLDEPTVGLDPQTRSHIWSYINQLRSQEDITIFLTTHYMDEAENCDRIAIIDGGSIVVIDTPEALKAGVGKDRVEVRTDDDVAAMRGLLNEFGLE